MSEKITKIKKIFENNSIYSINKKINENDTLSDANKHLLGVIVKVFECDDSRKIELIKENQIDMLLNNIFDMPDVDGINYFTTVQEFINFLMYCMPEKDFCMVDFVKLEDKHICDLNEILMSYDNKMSVRIDKEFLDFNPDTCDLINSEIACYLESEGIYDNYFCDDVKIATMRRSIDESKIFEGDDTFGKIERLGTMTENEIILLYGLLTGDYGVSYSPSLKYILEEEITRNPYGKIANTLSPLSSSEMTQIQYDHSSSNVSYDEFWKSLEDKYGKAFESYVKLFKRILPISESRKLLVSEKPFNIVKGINERLYVVGGKNNQYLRIIK